MNEVLLSKICCYLFVVGEEFGGKDDRLIGRSFDMFTINGIYSSHIHQSFECVLIYI